MINQNENGLNSSSQKENKIVNEQEQNKAVNTGNDPFTNAENLNNPAPQPDTEKAKKKLEKGIKENKESFDRNPGDDDLPEEK
jgi:hypothetical protein